MTRVGHQVGLKKFFNKIIKLLTKLMTNTSHKTNSLSLFSLYSSDIKFPKLAFVLCIAALFMKF